MSRCVLPLELRPLRAILARLSERSPEDCVGATISDWCRREGLHLESSTSVRTATVTLTNTFFRRAPGLLAR